MFTSYKNQSTDLLCKSVGWFLHSRRIRSYRVNLVLLLLTLSMKMSVGCVKTCFKSTIRILGYYIRITIRNDNNLSYSNIFTVHLRQIFLSQCFCTLRIALPSFFNKVGLVSDYAGISFLYQTEKFYDLY